MQIKQMADVAKKFVVKNAPTILTVVGCTGFISTVALAIKETPEAQRRIEAAKDNKLKDKDGNYIANKENYDNKLNVWEVVKSTAPVYWPMVVTGTASIVCVVGSNRIYAKRLAAAVAAYELYSRKDKEYRAKVKEIFGEKKEEKVRDSIAQDKTNRYADDISWVPTTGKVMCVDTVLGSTFEVSLDKLERAIIDIKQELLTEECVCLNDFRRKIGLSPIELGDDMGWKGVMYCEEPFDIYKSSTLLEDGRPALAITYEIGPLFAH